MQKKYKENMKDDQERALNLQNIYQHNHQVHVHGGHDHGFNPTQTIHGMNGMYEDESSCHYKYMCISPVSGVSMQSEGSTLSWLSSSDDGLPLPIPPTFEEIKPQMATRNTHYPNGIWLGSKLPDSPLGKKANGNLMDELDLSGNLCRMHIRDEQEDSSTIRPFPIDCSSVRTNNVEENGPFYKFRKDFSDYGRLQSSALRNPTSFDDEMRTALLGLQQDYRVGNLPGSYLYSSRSNALSAQPNCCTGLMNVPWQQSKESASNRRHTGIRVPNMVPISGPPIIDSFYSQRNGVDSSGDRGVLSSPSFPQLTPPKLPLSMANRVQYSLPKFNGGTGALPNSRISELIPSMRISCADSFIIQAKGLNYAINKRCDHLKGHKISYCNENGTGNPRGLSSELDGRPLSGGVYENGRSPKICCPLLQLLKFNSLVEVQGYIYFIAKDQQGCRFLQKKFEEGTPQDVQIIFNEIIIHVVELMMNPFGNYLMQKLLDVCNEEQRMQILFMVTENPGELVRISLNAHGTRAVQKLIETLKTRQQISLVISALEPGFLDLIKDLNGNHVVRRCLQCLSNEDNKFIFDAAAKFCVDIATHKHGCCVLQQCIAHSTGEHQEKIVAEISDNGLLLALDAFGNYVVQYILELKIPSVTATLISQFEGNYVHLSMQKFGSNVVEKCLEVFNEKSRSTIINEFLSTSHFEQFLQDPFANYVIQSALKVTKGPLHASLVEAILPHAAILRTNPSCKRIFSRNLLKK